MIAYRLYIWLVAHIHKEQWTRASPYSDAALIFLLWNITAYVCMFSICLYSACESWVVIDRWTNHDSSHMFLLQLIDWTSAKQMADELKCQLWRRKFSTSHDSSMTRSAWKWLNSLNCTNGYSTILCAIDVQRVFNLENPIFLI